MQLFWVKGFPSPRSVSIKELESSVCVRNEILLNIEGVLVAKQNIVTVFEKTLWGVFFLVSINMTSNKYTCAYMYIYTHTITHTHTHTYIQACQNKNNQIKIKK